MFAHPKTVNCFAVNFKIFPCRIYKNARCLMAGAASETLFEPEKYRHGSSLDELAFAEGLCANASYKLKHPVRELYEETFLAVLSILTRNQNVVRGITGEALSSMTGRFNPMGFVRDRYQQWRLGRNLEDLAKLMIDPGARRTLMRLAQEKSSSLPGKYFAAQIALQISEAVEQKLPAPAH